MCATYTVLLLLQDDHFFASERESRMVVDLEDYHEVCVCLPVCVVLLLLRSILLASVHTTEIDVHGTEHH